MSLLLDCDSMSDRGRGMTASRDRRGRGERSNGSSVKL